VTASWAKLAAALDEAELDKAAGRIKEQYLGIPSTSPVPPEVIAAASARRGVTAVRQGVVTPAVGVGIVPQPVMTQTPATRGYISADGPVVLQPGASNVPVPISAQAPITTIKDALPLLQTSQEQLIRTLTHSKLDVNSTGEAQNVTLLHRAAMKGADLDCFKALIAFGANINPRNHFNQTPLDLAAMTEMEDIAALLDRVGGVSGITLTNDQELMQGHAPQNPNAFNILSLSSSGPYCIVQLEILQQIEAQSGQRIIDLFQWIVACGFGALFLLLIVYGNKTMSDVKRLYFKLREEVFSLYDIAQRSQALDGFLQAHLGTQMKMSDIVAPRILIGALYKGTTRVETHLFNNCLNDAFSETPVWKVARYTCSLPLSIMESDNYTSTDLALPNLSSVGLRQIRKICGDPDPGVITSLVCVEASQFVAQELGYVDVPASALGDNPQWFSSPGALQKLGHLLTLQQSAALASGKECLKSCQEQCERYQIQFFHFSPLLPQRLTLSVDVSLKDVVDSVIETLSQECGKQLDRLMAFFNNV
jgi:hypothetical protein